MRHRFIGGALLAAVALLSGARPAAAQGGGPGGESFGFQTPLNTSQTVPIPTGRAGDAGFYTSFEYVMLNQARTLGNQVIAVRGLFDSSGFITGVPGTFIGSGVPALQTSDLGRTTFQPGYKIELGYRFDDNTVIFANFTQLINADYHAGASLVPQGQANNLTGTEAYLTAPVYNFPPQFAGPPIKTAFDATVVPISQFTNGLLLPATGTINLPFYALGPASLFQAGVPQFSSLGQGPTYNTYGIWNAATVMDIKYSQRYTEGNVGVRLPILQTEYSRVYSLAGARYAWFFERFNWRTVSYSLDGTATQFDTANYTNTLSQRMYGPFVGCGHEIFLANQFSLSLDLTAALLMSVEKERAKYKLGDSDYAVGPSSPPVATKWGAEYFDLVPNFNGSINLWWYPIEGVQLRFGYTAMTYFNTKKMEEPVGFNYGNIDPSYKTEVFRLLHGFNAGIGFFF
jgi:hypothetical protein